MFLYINICILNEIFSLHFVQKGICSFLWGQLHVLLQDVSKLSVHVCIISVLVHRMYHSCKKKTVFLDWTHMRFYFYKYQKCQ